MKSTRAYDVLVFDWDGTVMDSTALIVRSIQEAARDLGLPVPADSIASHVIGLGLADALAIAVPDLPHAQYPRLVERYVAHWRSHENDLVLFAGIGELLAELRARDYRLAVATGKSRAGLDRVLARGGLAQSFDWTRCADETHSKPHPQMLIDIMERFDSDPLRTLMIGDTTHDSQMAHNAGAHALSVTYGAHPREQLVALNPRGVVDSVAELARWLERHG
ncbi:MAG: HAD-IA family hydrolase [Burkholderiales bacterium]|nr:HAD-IA family hydrolase [Burkholderiales bacterium]